MVKDEVILRSFRSSLNALAANCGPRFEIILLGKPNRLNRLLNNSCATPSKVIVFVHGHKITLFKRPWSTTTKIESNLLERGKLVIKSIKQ